MSTHTILDKYPLIQSRTNVHSYNLGQMFAHRCTCISPVRTGQRKITNTDFFMMIFFFFFFFFFRRVRRMHDRERLDSEESTWWWARIWSSQGDIENTKGICCLSAVFWATSWLEGVPKIVLIQMTKKLVKNIFSISVNTKDRFKTGLKFSSTFG